MRVGQLSSPLTGLIQLNKLRDDELADYLASTSIELRLENPATKKGHRHEKPGGPRPIDQHTHTNSELLKHSKQQSIPMEGDNSSQDEELSDAAALEVLDDSERKAMEWLDSGGNPEGKKILSRDAYSALPFTQKLPRQLQSFSLNTQGACTSDSYLRSVDKTQSGMGGVVIEGMTEPPLLPPLLDRTILPSSTSSTHLKNNLRELPVPSSVQINHLYASSSKKNGVIGLAVSQRFRKKFVTTILYKPM